MLEWTEMNNSSWYKSVQRDPVQQISKNHTPDYIKYSNSQEQEELPEESSKEKEDTHHDPIQQKDTLHIEIGWFTYTCKKITNECIFIIKSVCVSMHVLVWVCLSVT